VSFTFKSTSLSFFKISPSSHPVMFLKKDKHQDVYTVDGFFLLKSHPKIFEWVF